VMMLAGDDPGVVVVASRGLVDAANPRRPHPYLRCTRAAPASTDG
jgi:hypothetical protein